MADINGFDANEVEPNKGFEVVPPDRYEVIITESAWEDNKAGTGKFIKLVMQIVGGPHAGKPLIDRLNLVNPSDKAVQIAKGTLSAICRAVNVLKPRDTSELHNLPLIARVDVEEYEPGKFSNPVNAYYPKQTAQAATGTDGKPAGGAAPAKPVGAPWLTKVK